MMTMKTMSCNDAIDFDMKMYNVRMKYNHLFLSRMQILSLLVQGLFQGQNECSRSTILYAISVIESLSIKL